MEFQIIDVDYVLVNDRPVLRLFGKDARGKTVVVFREDFLPYFYARGENAEQALKDEPQVMKMVDQRKKVIFDKVKEADVKKVFLKNPQRTPEIRERIKEKGVIPYEADVLFKYRYMNDEGIMGMGWAKAKNGSGAATNTVLADVKVNCKKVEPVEKLEELPLKMLAFDIECVPTVPGNMPEATRDPIILISLVFSTEYKGMKSMVLATRKGDYVKDFMTEKEMLEDFINIINEYDPDILTGYNVNGFDLPYILERMKRTSVRPVFGRCAQKAVMARKVGQKYRVSIVGRIIVDSFDIIKKDFNLHRYSLDAVSRVLLGEKKIDVKHSEIEKLWKGGQDDYNLLVNYCRKDSVLAMDLVNKLGLLDKYVALSRLSGTLLQDTLESGETTRIELYLLREFNRKGYIMPCRPDDSIVGQREKDRRKELVGGYVIEPDKGLHKNVAVLDFKSMYPSIIRTFNICPTTLTGGDRKDLITTPSGARFLPKDEAAGIVPMILENLMNSRGAVKKQIRVEKDANKKRILDAKQWALKILANAFYGHMGYPRAKIYHLDIANAITSSGRDIIQSTSKEIEEKYGLKIVYGDTDSVFVKMDDEDLDELGKKADIIAAHITKKLPGVMELEFEKAFRRFLPLTKKRYAAWKFERAGGGWKEGIDMKGIETVRRDWCPLVSETLKKVIEIILIKEDVKGAVSFFKGVVKDLSDGKIGMEKLVITKGMTKAIKSYAGTQPHIELVKKLTARNPADAPGVGDRISYIIIKGRDLVSKRTEDPSYAKEHGLEIDPCYYIENQLMPPIERIFSTLNITKSELLGNGKQMGIMEALKCNVPTRPLKEVAMKDVNGFECAKCSRKYSRVPLVGLCECGGGMLFSTSRGPAEKALLA